MPDGGSSPRASARSARSGPTPARCVRAPRTLYGVQSRERFLPTWPSAGQLLRFIWLWILRGGRVLGTVVHLKLLRHRAPQPVVLEHALHRPLDGQRRPFFEQPVVPDSREP